MIFSQWSRLLLNIYINAVFRVQCIALMVINLYFRGSSVQFEMTL